MTAPPRTPGNRAKRIAVLGLAVAVTVGALWWLLGAPARGDVKRVAHTDPKLQAAAQRAQSELESFIAQIQHPRPREQFAIKGAFPTFDGNEYLWIRDPRYEVGHGAGGKFTGILDQNPIAYRGAKKGDSVTVSRDRIFDWLIKDGEETRGGYTEQVLSQEQRGQ